MYCIYKITNVINNKSYIGKTNNIEKRIKKHLYLTGKGIKRHLYNAILLYGWENFIVEIIQEGTKENINSLEVYWINHFETTNKEKGYNATFGGEGGDTWTLNQNKYATSKKLRIKNTGQKRSKEFCEKMSSLFKGRKVSEEQKEQISETLKKKYANGEIIVSEICVEFIKNQLSRKGIKHKEESKQKMSIARKGKKYEDILDEETSLRIKEKSKERMLSKNNINYKEINEDELLSLLENGFKNKEISVILSISKPTVISKTLAITGMNPREYRNFSKSKKGEKHENLF